MNSKGAEFSIFQGASSIHVDNNQARIEEEEALQDQIRRHAELNNELQNAFEDLDYDDDGEETMNSTKGSNVNSYHKNHPMNNHQIQQPFSLRDSETHFKNQMDSKTREIEYVTTQLTAERKQHKTLVDEYEKRLAIAEAEKERALMTRSQTHELLVENKSRSIEMEEVNEKLRSKIKSLETENSSLVGELESTKLMLTDVQIKYNMVEKNVMFNADRNTDIIIKQAQERNSAQTAMMQQQIDGLKSKYEDLEHEHKNLEIRYKELQRSRESMLIEKSEIVNHLNKNLEDAQRQCQDLLARPNLSQENRQLQNLVRSMENQKEEFNQTISKLQKRIKEQTSEMELMDSIVQECGGNNVSFSESTKFIQRDPLKNVNSSIPLAPEARLARVKEELYKSLNNIKNKREEIKICEQQLREKDDEIKQLKNDENTALVRMNQFRDETIRLESKMKILEKEIDKLRQELLHKSSASHNCVTDDKYEDQLKVLRQENEALEAELNSIKSDYERLAMKNGELLENEDEWLEKVQQLEADMKLLQDSSPEELNEERENVRLLDEQLKTNKQTVDQATQGDAEDNVSQSKTFTSTCEKCEELLMKFEKLEISCLQMQNANADKLKEIQEMEQKLTNAHKEIKHLEEKLNLKELRDQEIENLKQKAQEFEEYMRTNTRSGSAASSLTNTVSTTTSDFDEHESRKLRQIETKIRDEMAKIFAAETKSIEKRFREDAENWHNRLITVSSELEEKCIEHEASQEQINCLMFTIQQERQESEERLKEKDDDLKVALEKYRAEYENNQLQIEDLTAQLSENKELIDEERRSIENLTRQINKERESLARREEEMINKYKQLQLDSTKLMKELNEKYASAKRTALNYKQYSEDKENHFRKQCERSKAACIEMVERMTKELKETIKEKDKTIKKMEHEFEYKVEVLKEMLGTKT